VEKHSWYTALFEMLAENLMGDITIAAAGEYLGLSWGAASGIMERAVARGLARRGKVGVKALGTDETPYKKGRDYVGVILDKGRDMVTAVLPDGCNVFFGALRRRG
jgi:transposase